MRHPVTGDDVILDCGVEDTDGNEHEALRYPAHPRQPSRARSSPTRSSSSATTATCTWTPANFGQLSSTSCQHIVYRLWGESYFDAPKRFTFLW